MNNKFIVRIVVIIFICLYSTVYYGGYYAYGSIDNSIQVNRIEKYWWGYRRYLSDEEISKFASIFDSLAAELSLLGGLSTSIIFLNPIAGGIASAVFEISSSYCWLLSTYFVKINNGNGIVIDFTKGIIFRIRAI